MKIVNVKFVKSYANADKIEDFEKPEIAIVGRSNVGKSSFINFITNAQIAKTSSLPGRTRLINFFDVNNGEFIFVDLPGYGYAKASKQEQDKWGSLIGGYLTTSKNLKHTIVLVDVRLDPSVRDLMMINYLNSYQLSYTIIATKCDKLSRSQVFNRKRQIAAAMKVGIENVLVVSSRLKTGKDEVLERLERFVVTNEE